MLKNIKFSLIVVTGYLLSFNLVFASIDGTRTFSYVLKGKKGSITIGVDSQVYSDIYHIPRVPCYTCTSLAERDRPIVTNEEQKSALAPLVNAIKSKTSNPDDQVRIAVSLVQNIPYDYPKSLISTGTHFRYPYEVVYDNQQVCSENSFFIAFLLHELGYGNAVFYFPNVNHETVGVKCPIKYSYMNTGYCFIESTYRNMITYDTMERRNHDNMEIEELFPDGLAFNPKKDFNDAAKYKKYAYKKKLSKKNKKSRKKIKKYYGM